MDDDDRGWGGAWWQWFQSCGDPHAVRWDATAGQFVARTDGYDTQLHRIDCSTNTIVGPTSEFKAIVGRFFPRAAPGTITELLNDFETGSSRLVGLTGTELAAPGVGREVVVWLPDLADGSPTTITVENLVGVRYVEVDGGRILVATIDKAGCYAVHANEAVISCPTAPVEPVPPARPIPVRPGYVG
jgi:endoglycosylceramidase